MQAIETDVVVVGSGPGGAGVVRELVKAGKKVHIVEMGPDRPPKGNALGAAGFTGGLLGTLGLRKGLLVSREWLTIVRGVSTGGSSMLYLGTAYDPDPDMWTPFGFDLKEEAEQIKKELGVGPLPDKLIGAGSHAVTKAAQDLGYGWGKLNKFVDVSKCEEGCNVCIYGCHRGAKWHARDWVLEAVDEGATIINECACERVITEGDKAVGIRVKKNGDGFNIYADKILLAAGGVGSPRILQSSGVAEAGQSFFFDPFVMTTGIFARRQKPGVMMATGMHLKEEGLMFADMQYPRVMLAMQGLMAGKVFAPWRYRTTFPIMIKIRDDMTGPIGKSLQVNKKLTDNDKKKLEKGKEIASEILIKAGAKAIWHSRIGAAHPGGTCAMGTVVDENMETKYKNLFVCDASVIPVPFGIPPTLTCLALGRRLTKHLLS